MTSQTADLGDLISVIEIAAPSLAELMGGPLGGVLATGVVRALQSGGIGADLSPATPASIAPLASGAPLDLLKTLLSGLDTQASDHISQVTAAPAASPQSPVALVHTDGGFEVNPSDSTTKIAMAVVGAAVAMVGLVSPNTATLLTQYVPVVGGIAAMLAGMWLNHRTVQRSNDNTRLLNAQLSMG